MFFWHILPYCLESMDLHIFSMWPTINARAKFSPFCALEKALRASKRLLLKRRVIFFALEVGKKNIQTDLSMLLNEGPR
jgi:hypothetical protein